MLERDVRIEPGKKTLVETRKKVERRWFTLARRLTHEGHADLASEVPGFVRVMPPPQTDRELVGEALRHHAEQIRHPVQARSR